MDWEWSRWIFVIGVGMLWPTWSNLREDLWRYKGKSGKEREGEGKKYHGLLMFSSSCLSFFWVGFAFLFLFQQRGHISERETGRGLENGDFNLTSYIQANHRCVFFSVSWVFLFWRGDGIIIVAAMLEGVGC
ncbi:hypothetical protein B0T17DRAFT_106203 [Bombardia bombarda]|uniref:Transmembrane protein n=1 Tax=Bombardia bombarda TaxID=252184 RepID=A0AA39XNI6_9PEZI|nr:hypothetical protein B0T17DRAFT_106203 [Bombardia bombarda]